MISFQKYNTVISDGDLNIIDVRWGGGELTMYYVEENVTYKESVDSNFPQCELYIVVFDHNTESLYRIEFAHIEGYRLLNEGGLLNFWACENYNHKELGSILKVMNSPWSKESIIPFVYSEETSYLIITETDCVEVITDNAPIIHFLKKVEPKEGKYIPWDE